MATRIDALMGELQLTFWDVQHGSACYIRTPSGKHLVVDLGSGDITAHSEAFSPLRYLKYNLGIERLDGVLLTHPHRDHLDDIDNFYLLNPEILCCERHLTDEQIRGGNRSVDQPKIEQYLQIRRYYSGPGKPSGAGPFDAPTNGCGFFQIWQPMFCDRGNLNNHSAVAIIEFAATKILITGDNEACAWAELLSVASFRAAVAGTSIFLAAHHGRQSGFCPDLYEAMGTPLLTIVSDGRYSDTSVTSEYCRRSRGWDVFSRRTGLTENRKCLTTRSDGSIEVKCWPAQDGINYLSVSVE